MGINKGLEFVVFALKGTNENGINKSFIGIIKVIITSFAKYARFLFNSLFTGLEWISFINGAHSLNTHLLMNEADKREQ